MATDTRHLRRHSQRDRRSPVTSHKPSVSEGGSLSSIKVVARFRPMIEIESEEIAQGRAWQACTIEGTQVHLDQGREEPVTFTFDHIFGEDSQQEELFQITGEPLISDIFEGFNATIFTYGPTGSGKTFTMIGGDLYDLKTRGIVPRCGSSIFERISNAPSDVKFTLSCSVLEIYRERLRDLLRVENQELKVKESPTSGVYVENLTTVSVVNENELLDVFELGTKMKTMASTKLNLTSSRSHSIFIIEVLQKSESVLRGQLNLVDLAGSEKVSKAETKGVTFEETKKINLSLSALGNVIHALSSNNLHVPYRDSKLTRLLQDSLGGNYKTSLIVNCNSFSGNVEETLSTLRFAQRAKRVKNKARQNISRGNPLEAEIFTLRGQLADAYDELKKYRENTPHLGTVETEIERNKLEIQRLKEEEHKLKKELAIKRERCSAGEINCKLAELKRNNEEKVVTHLKFKAQVLQTQLDALQTIANSAERELESLDKVKSVTFDIEKPLSGLATTEHTVDLKNPADRELVECINAQLQADIKLIEWEILSEFIRNKQFSMMCLQQQEQMKMLEVIIDKLRKHHKVLRNALYRDSPFSLSDENTDPSKNKLSHLESSLDILKSQLALTEMCLSHQLAQNNQQKNWISDLEKKAEELLKDNLQGNTKLSELYADASAELEATEAQIAQMQKLLASLIEDYLAVQKQCGMPIDKTLKVLESLDLYK